jgi:hypothetical protein
MEAIPMADRRHQNVEKFYRFFGRKEGKRRNSLHNSLAMGGVGYFP